MQVGVPLEWLDAADFAVNTVIAVATVVALIWAITSTKRQLGYAAAEIHLARSDRMRQNADSMRQFHRERRQQAEHVAAWSEQRDIYETFGDDDEGRPISQVVDTSRKLLVANTSSTPIWDVVVTYDWSANSGETTLRLPILAPTAQPLEHPVPGLGFDSPEVMLVGIRFRDSGGRTWERDKVGQLKLLHDPDARSARSKKA